MDERGKFSSKYLLACGKDAHFREPQQDSRTSSDQVQIVVAEPLSPFEPSAELTHGGSIEMMKVSGRRKKLTYL